MRVRTTAISGVIALALVTGQRSQESAHPSGRMGGYEKQGEWFAVRLSPELRKLGTPMRWFKNEDQGWVHESTVEVVSSSADR